MKITELQNGNLEITLEAEEELNCANKFDSINNFLDLLEKYSCNGSYSLIYADELGALSTAPCIVDKLLIDDNGDIENPNKLWAFNNYMIEDFLETLKEERKVIFNKIN